MRIGFNPNKDKELDSTDFIHQVVVPVFIPNHEDYFKDSFRILKYCLESLFKTSHNKTFFTIINNGSDKIVVDYLNNLLADGIIHELIHTNNIGKLNAILKGITGQKFQLITISDADVLFLNGWQNETYKIFKYLPKAGVVCPTPSSKSFNDKTFNILSELFFSNKLKFVNVQNPNALTSFAHSIGNSRFYNECHLQKILVVNEGEAKAVVGAGHFVATYRCDVFTEIGITHSNYVLGGDSENKILDLPSIKRGLWRLSTYDNYAFHLGNVEEPWMDIAFNDLKSNDDNSDIKFDFKSVKISSLEYWLKNTIFPKLIYRKKLRRFFLRYKGLTKEQANNY
jgi:hypothetical protein